MLLGGRTTDPSPGTHTCVNGTVISVTAIPDLDFSFDYWLLDGEPHYNGNGCQSHIGSILRR